MAKKILIVEDNQMNRLLIKDILAYHGYETAEAGDGNEGIAKARELLPDLILMDIQMPVMDGFTATKKLKADPATQRIKIIALTAFAMKGDMERYMEAGFEEYLTKPIDNHQIVNVVRKHLGEESKEM